MYVTSYYQYLSPIKRTGRRTYENRKEIPAGTTGQIPAAEGSGSDTAAVSQQKNTAMQTIYDGICAASVGWIAAVHDHRMSHR